METFSAFSTSPGLSVPSMRQGSPFATGSTGGAINYDPNTFTNPPPTPGSAMSSQRLSNSLPPPSSQPPPLPPPLSQHSQLSPLGAPPGHRITPLPSGPGMMNATSPSMIAAAVQNAPMMFSTAAVPSASQIIRPGSANSSSTPNPASAMASTSVTPSAVAAGSGAFFGTYHLRSTVEMNAMDDKAMEALRRTLMVLQDIGDGGHLVNWADLIDPERPAESARTINATLSKPALQATRSEDCRTIASLLTTPRHLSILRYLDDEYKSQVRDLLLQDLLGQMEQMEQVPPASHTPMPHEAEMLAEMAALNLVRLNGVAATVDQLLAAPAKRRAGIALLGRVAEQQRGNEAFTKIIANSSIGNHLRGLYTEPGYEYDAIAITRLLYWSEAERSSARLLPVATLRQPAPVTALQYFGTRDELVTGQANGTVVLWGGPNSSGEVPTKGTLDMPYDCVPVAMSGPPLGNFLVVSGMPFPPNSPYAACVETRKHQRLAEGGSGLPTPSSASPTPVLRVLECSGDNGMWTNRDLITRPQGTILTAVAALPNSLICSAESAIESITGTPSSTAASALAAGGAGAGATSGAGVRHSINIYSGGTGRLEHSLNRVHAGYTTVLTACENSQFVILSGSRDATVKVWDIRRDGGSSADPALVAGAGGALPLHKLEPPHTDTVTTLYTAGDYVFSGALDGSLFMWDMRRMRSPVGSKVFASPVLGVTGLEGGRFATSTARGLFLLTRENMGVLDVVPNVAFTQIQSNKAGNTVFAAGREGVTMFSLEC